jgi:hypothetical protein
MIYIDGEGFSLRKAKTMTTITIEMQNVVQEDCFCENCGNPAPVIADEKGVYLDAHITRVGAFVCGSCQELHGDPPECPSGGSCFFPGGVGDCPGYAPGSSGCAYQ